MEHMSTKYFSLSTSFCTCTFRTFSSKSTSTKYLFESTSKSTEYTWWVFVLVLILSKRYLVRVLLLEKVQVKILSSELCSASCLCPFNDTRTRTNGLRVILPWCILQHCDRLQCSFKCKLMCCCALRIRPCLFSLHESYISTCFLCKQCDLWFEEVK